MADRKTQNPRRHGYPQQDEGAGAGRVISETFGGWDVRVAGRRAAACLLDTSLALALSLVAFLPLLFVGDWSIVLFLTLLLVYVLLWCAIFLTYVALLDGYLGRTLGKTVFGIQVVGAEHGRPPGPWRAALRASTFLFVDMFLGLFVMLRSPRRQRLGDIAANTLVVRRGERQSKPAPSRAGSADRA